VPRPHETEKVQFQMSTKTQCMSRLHVGVGCIASYH